MFQLLATVLNCLMCVYLSYAVGSNCTCFCGCIVVLCFILLLCDHAFTQSWMAIYPSFAVHPDDIVAVIPLHRTLYFRGKRYTHAALNAHTIDYMYKAGIAGMYVVILVSVLLCRI